MDVWSTMPCMSISLRRARFGEERVRKVLKLKCWLPKLTTAIKNTNRQKTVSQKPKAIPHLLSYSLGNMFYRPGLNCDLHVDEALKNLSYHLQFYLFLMVCEIIQKARQRKP